MTASAGTELVELTLPTRTLVLEQLADLGALVQDALHARQAGPYWGYLWPSARALADLVATLPDLRDKRVLDLGCGLGAIALAAAAAGAEVVAADRVPEAVALAERNAARNGLTIEVLALDWDAPPEDLGRFDVILAADVFYEDGMLRGVLRFIRRHLAEDGLAWIADPMRVAPAGVDGAARLHGLEASGVVLVPGDTMNGGVTLHELTWRRR